MSIISNLYQGVSGLSANSARMEVTGNNIANVNTVGFKAGRANFEEILGRTVMGSNANNHIGQGSRMAGVDQNFSQGAFLATGSSTDLAVGGEGFFQVRGTQGGTDGSFYTRAGQFRFDDEGSLVTAGGLKLQGYQVGADGEVGNKVGDINIPNSPSPPKATDNVEIGVGLRSDEPTINALFDPNDPTGTSSHSTTVTVYDSLGQAHEVDVYYNKTADNEWEYHALAKNDEIQGGLDDGFSEIGSGTLVFNTDGQLQTETGAGLSVTFTGAAAQGITLDFGESIDEGGTGATASKQHEQVDYDTFRLEQNGRSSGNLQGIRVDADGSILGSYSNGEEVALGRVALARFASNQGLENVGGNLFQATGMSGEPVVGAANNGGRGAIFGGALEQSNVDLAAEFVNLITAQRGYQANARTITTADQVYAETVNLKQ
jgi:flagellar hook protein FlgE